MTHDLILYYIVGLYGAVLPLTAWGALSPRFDANILQRLALFGFSLWSAWRISLIFEHGYSWPHEPVVVTALALYAAGTVQKTLSYRGCDHA